MKKTTGRIVAALALAFAIGHAQTARADFWDWVGKGSGETSYFDEHGNGKGTTGCWYHSANTGSTDKFANDYHNFESVGSSTRPSFNSGWDKVVTFRKSSAMNGNVNIVYSSAPIVFVAEQPAYGIDGTGNLNLSNSSTLQIDSGTYSFGCLQIGITSGKTATLVVNGGTVKAVTTYSRLGMSGGSGVLTVKSGGTYDNTDASNKNFTLGQESGSSGTLNVQGGNVRVGGYVALNYHSSAKESHVNVTDGGVLEVNQIYLQNQGTSGGTLTIDGGTLKAIGSNSDYFTRFLPAGSGFNVYIGANAATIDANGHDIVISASLQDKSGDAGAVLFKGASVITLTGTSSYTGGTTVEIGTTLSMASPSCIPGAIAVTLPSGLAAGRYVVLTTTGSTAFDASIIEGVAVPEDCELALADGGKTVVCIYKGAEMAAGIWLGTKNNDLCDGDNWSGGTVPNGAAATISCAAAATLVCSGSFTPTGITFPAGSALVTISGPGEISGISSIVNNTSLHHVFNCQVTCPDGVTPNITRTEAAYMTFAGGLSMHDAPNTGNAAFDYWSGEVSLRTGSTLRFDTGNQKYLFIPKGSTFSVKTASVDHVFVDIGAKLKADRLVYNGCCRVANNGWYNTVFDNGNGTLRVGEIRTEGDAVLFHSFAGDDLYGGTIIADKLMCATTAVTGGAFPYPIFILNCGALYAGGAETGVSVGEGVWAIGPGGLSFPTTAISDRSHYETLIGKSLGGRPAATLYSFADWTLMPHPNARGKCALRIGEQNGGFVRIDTSHYNIGEPEYDNGATGHTVTLDGSVQGEGWMLATGTGRLVFANENNTLNGANGLLVSNSVTVVVKNGCKPCSSKVTLRDTSTLELRNGASTAGHVYASAGTTVLLPEDGTATIGGNISFWSNSNAKFHVGKSGNAKLAITGTTTAAKNITISLTEDSEPDVGRAYTLTQGAGLTALETDETSIKLADGVRGDLSVVDGELVYTAPEYFHIKIAESSTSDLEVPLSWVCGNTAVDGASSAAEIETALKNTGANGIPVWQSYCLGLNPNEAASVVLCDSAETQPSDGTVKIAAKNLNVPEGLSGVTVKARLYRKKNGGEWEAVGDDVTVSSGTAVLASPTLGEGTSFFQIKVVLDPV